MAYSTPLLADLSPSDVTEDKANRMWNLDLGLPKLQFQSYAILQKVIGQLATGGWSQLDLFLNLSGEPLQRSLFDYFCPMGGGPVEIKPVRDNSKDLPGTEPKYPQRLKRYIFDGLGAGSDRDKEKKPDPGESLLSGWFLEELKRTGQRYRDIAFAPEKGDEVMVRIQTEMSSQ